MEIESGRWAQFAGKEQVRIHHKTTNTTVKTYSYGDKLVRVVFSYNDPWTDKLMKRFERYELRAQGFIDLTLISEAQFKIFMEKMTVGSGPGAMDWVSLAGAIGLLIRQSSWADVLLVALTQAPLFYKLGLASITSCLSRMASDFSQQRQAQGPSLGAWVPLLGAILVGYTIGGEHAVGKLLKTGTGISIPTLVAISHSSRFINEVWDKVVPYVYELVTGTPYMSEELIESCMDFVTLSEQVTRFQQEGLPSKIQNSEPVCEEVLRMERDFQRIMSNRSRAQLLRKSSYLVDSVAKKIGAWVQQVEASGKGKLSAREVPLCIRFYGASGKGKSHLIMPFAAHLLRGECTLREGETFSSLVYTRRVGSEYWSGYVDQPVIVYDDFGQRTDVAGSPNPEFMELIDLVNTVPFRPNMAAVEDKARTYANPKLVILTSNNDKFVTKSITHPDALYRRLHIDVEVDRTRVDAEMANRNGIDLNAYQFSVRERDEFGRKSDAVPMSFNELVIFAKEKRQELGRGSRVTKFADQIYKNYAQSNDGTLIDFLRVARFNYINAEPSEETMEIMDFLTGRTEPYLGYCIGYRPRDPEQLHEHCMARDLPFETEEMLEDLGIEIEYRGDDKERMPPAWRVWLTTAQGVADQIEHHFGLAWVYVKTFISHNTTRKMLAGVAGGAIAIGAVVGLIKWLFGLFGVTKKEDGDEKFTHVDCECCNQAESRQERTTKVIAESRSEREQRLRVEGCVDLQSETMSIVVRKNMISLTKAGKLQGWALAIKDKKVIMPEHIHKNISGFEIEFDSLKQGKTTGIYDCDARSLGDDLVLVDLGTLVKSSFTNITRHFVSKADIQRKNFQVILTIGERIKYGDAELSHEVVDYVSGVETIKIKGCIKYYLNTRAGDCGAILLHQEKRIDAKIMGMHVAGAGSGLGISRLITRDELTDLVAQGEQFQVLTPLGKISPVHEVNFTRIKKSELHGIFPVTKKPALLRDKEGVSPFWKAVERYDIQKASLNCAALDEYCDFYTMRKGPFVGLLSWFESCHGIKNDQVELLPLARTHSPGYPFVLEGRGKGKSFWLGSGEQRFIHLSLMERLLELEEQADKLDLTTQPIFIDTLKDERRPIEKADWSNPDKIKTRLFSASPMDFTILMRRYLGAFVLSLRENKIKNCFTAGIDPQSMDWTELALHLEEAGQRMYDGDWSAFDASLSEDLIANFTRVADRWYQAFDPEWDISHSRIRKWIGQCLARSWHVARGELIQWQGGLPSGAFGTNDIDSMANLYVFAGAARSVGMFPTDFQIHVRMAFHGDDNDFSVSPKWEERFTPRAIAEFGRKLGMTYTSGDKSDSMEWKTIDTLVFLKRKFRKDGLFYWAPLDDETIKDMVQWYKDGPLSKREAQYCIWRDALEEAVAHNDPALIGRIVSCLRDRGHYVVVPSLGELRNRYFMGDRLRSEWENNGNVFTESPELSCQTFMAQNGSERPSNLTTASSMTHSKTLAKADTSLSMPKSRYYIDSKTKQGLGLALAGMDTKLKGQAFSESDIKTITGWRKEDQKIGAREGMSNVPEVPNENADMRIQTVNFIDQVTPAMGRDPYARTPEDWMAFARDEKKHSIESILERPFPIMDVLWRQSDPPGSVLWRESFPDFIFSNLLSYTQKMANFQFARFNLVIRMAPNAMQFHQGRLLLAFDPLHEQRGGRAGNLSPQYLTGLNHVEINPNQHKPGMLKIPFVAPLSHYDLTAGQFMQGDVILYVLNSAKSAVPTQAISISPSIWLTDVELCVPAPTQLNAPAITALNLDRLVAQSGEDVEKKEAQKTGTLSSALETISGVAGVAAEVPLLHEVAKPVEWITKFGAHVARYFGYNKPSCYTGPTTTYPVTGQSTAHMDGISQAVRLAAAEDNELPMIRGLFSTEADEMDIGYIVSKFNFYDFYTWNVGTPVGSTIAQWYVHPGMSLPINGPDRVYDYETTLTSFVASLFKYWTGTMKYRLEVVSTNFHAGRLLINYTPNFNRTLQPASQTLQDFAHTWSIVLDISEGNEVEFEVPYINGTPMTPVILDDNNLSYLAQRSDTTTGEDTRQFSNGAITVVVLSELVNAESAATSVELNLWVAGGDDLAFYVPNTSSYAALSPFGTQNQLTVPITGWPVNPDALVAQGGENYYNGSPTGPDAMTEGFDHGAFEQLMPMDHQQESAPVAGGEKIMSLRQMIKRLTMLCSAIPSGADRNVYIDPCHFVTYPHSATNAQILFNKKNDVTTAQTLISYISHLYAAFRGGRRYMVTSLSGFTWVGIDPNIMTNIPPGEPRLHNATNPFTYNQASNPFSMGFGGLAGRTANIIQGAATNRALEIEVPQNSRMPFNIITDNPSQDALRAPIVERQYLDVVNLAGLSEQTRVFEGAAEDFTFGVRVGAPRVRRVGYSGQIITPASNFFY
jgi:hypothetical protein